MASDSNYFEDSPDVESGDVSKNTEEKATALLPKSFFGAKDKKIGDKCEIKVVKIMDDEIQVEYIARGTSEDDGEEMSETVVEESEMMEDMA